MSLRSMTGFGGAQGEGLECELRSVNHRNLDVRVRVPEGWQAMERALLHQ